MKLRKKAAAVPFFTPIIGIILGLILSVLALCFGWFNSPEPETVEQVEQNYTQVEK